ncbi:MAG: hypothetical protein ACXAE3_12090, partial [Candidatus Kariarchaeaceae archaeon]
MANLLRFVNHWKSKKDIEFTFRLVLAKFYFWVHRDRNLDWKEVDRVRPVLKNLYENIPLMDQDDQVLDPGLYQKRIDLRKQYHKLFGL